MSENGSGLRPNQRKAVEALASGSTVEEAALVAQVTDRTIYNWRTEAPFKQALQDMSDVIMGEAVTLLTGVTVRAIKILIDIADDTKVAPGTRVSAARTLLDSTLKTREMYELEKRIQELESRPVS